jgi:hypothetical protein
MFNISLVFFLLQAALSLAASGPTQLSSAFLQTAVHALSDSVLPTQQASSPASGKRAVTTVFWVGERADRDNDYISNAESAWDRRWEEHFGGYDDPDDRCGYRPCGFEPDENPFYVALPYNDLDDDGDRKDSASDVPWFGAQQTPGGSILKDHWVAVSHKGTTCYGQWEDVGPNNESDFAYVFGSASEPENTFGEDAGLDVSPAMRDCLGMDDVAVTTWRFADADEVADGPWLDIITDR